MYRGNHEGFLGFLTSVLHAFENHPHFGGRFLLLIKRRLQICVVDWFRKGCLRR